MIPLGARHVTEADGIETDFAVLQERLSDEMYTRFSLCPKIMTRNDKKSVSGHVPCFKDRKVPDQSNGDIVAKFFVNATISSI